MSSPMQMHLNDIQPCKRCQRLCNREHFAREPVGEGRMITYLYCEDCNRGWETLWERDGGWWQTADNELEHSAHDPQKLEEFLTNLYDARCVAA